MRPSGHCSSGGHHPSGCGDGVTELVIGYFGPRWRLLGFVAQNQRNGTVGSCQTTRACQAEEATTKGSRELARGDRTTQHDRAAILVRARASWWLGFAS